MSGFGRNCGGIGSKKGNSGVGRWLVSIGVAGVCLAAVASAQSFTARATWSHDGVNVTEFQASIDGAPYAPIVPTPAIVPNTPTSYIYTLPPVSAGNHSFALRACNVTSEGQACSTAYTVAFNAAVIQPPPPAPQVPAVTITISVTP